MNKRHAVKMARKRALKAARRAQYAALAGTSLRRKRQVTGSTPPSGAKHSHAMPNCGNAGCRKCYPRLIRRGDPVWRAAS